MTRYQSDMGPTNIVIDTLSAPRPNPHSSYPQKEEKTKRETELRAVEVKEKEMALLIKPASATPTKAVWLRSFQRDRKVE